MRRDLTPTDELISQALKSSEYSESQSGAFSDRYWEPVRVLRVRADDEVIRRATELLRSFDKHERCLGANILSEMQIWDEARGAAAAELLAEALEKESDELVLEALVFAVGHTPCARACARLQELAHHPSSDVRHAVAYALPMHDDYREMTSTLIGLMKDGDSDVRDWATFGLGSLLETDTVEVRDALRARLTDVDDDARGEALVGLACRGDTSVIPVIFEELRSLKSNKLPKWTFLTEAAEKSLLAAEKSGDREWLPMLKELRRYEAENFSAARIEEVILLCS